MSSLAAIVPGGEEYFPYQLMTCKGEAKHVDGFNPFLADMLHVKILRHSRHMSEFSTSLASGTQALTTKSMTSKFYDEIVAKVQDWPVMFVTYIYIYM